MKSVMTHQFSRVPKAEIPRSSFDRSHGYKTTFDSGYLVPIFVDEALPGDTFNLKMTGFARMATPIFPVMDNMFMETFFFAVPHRLVWDNWERFCGSQDDPGDSTDYTIPQVNVTPTTGLSIAGYFGLAPNVAEMQVNALPFRAYNLIYNEWFRDQNLINSRPVNRDDGPDDSIDYTLLRRNKRHDYFTSALPWPQKGDSIDLPIGVSAPVHAASTGATDHYGVFDDFDGAAREFITGGGTPEPIIGGAIEPEAPLYADLSSATAVTINQLRQAFQIQKLLERDARGGTRYTEVIRAHFGVTSPDARLQRPEYLGGGSTAINISPVPQTSSTDDTVSPQGNLAAYATASLHGHGFTKSFTEHCVILGFVNVRGDISYQQGIERMWSRQTRYDYYWPALAHIGEQAILNKEIYFQDDPADDDVFGYQERYAEYRYKPSRITGRLNSNALEPLDAWHIAQEFESLPTLSAAFIVDRPAVHRVVAVPDEPQFIFDSYFNLRCARPMPLYGVPGFTDRF